MTVKELKEQIANLPDNMELVLQIDSEGNGYHPVRGIDPDGIMTDDGECYDASWTADEACMEEDEWEEFKKKSRVGVVYP
jgi:hypothetical protein